MQNVGLRDVHTLHGLLGVEGLDLRHCAELVDG